VVAACPLQRHRDRGGNLLSTLMGSGGPAAAADLGAEERQRVLGAAHDVLRRFVREGVTRKLTVILPQLAPSSRACWADGVSPLLQFGYTDTSTSTSVVDLSRDLDELERRLSKGHRAQLKRARKHGIEIIAADSPEHMDEYYRLHVETYTRTGIPPHPRAYFDAIFEHMVRGGHAQILMARHRGQFVGATNVARFGDSSLYWTGAYSRESLRLDAGKLLQWEAICRSKAGGLRYHETGEVFPDAEPGTKLAGLTTFKMGFGGDVRPWFKGEITEGSVR